MFCPRCGSNQNEELKFCKACGANLYAVRQVVDSRETEEKFNWNKTWVAEMFQSSEEAIRRQKALELARGLTPEVKRYNEIKAGVITGSVGFAMMIFLFIFMQGIILGTEITPGTAEILSRLWVAGVLPIFIGLALIFNGVFISKKLLDTRDRITKSTSELPDTEAEPPALRPANTTQFVPANLSVTEDTTQHLQRKEENHRS
jgi:hypothetical protein